MRKSISLFLAILIALSLMITPVATNAAAAESTEASEWSIVNTYDDEGVYYNTYGSYGYIRRYSDAEFTNCIDADYDFPQFANGTFADADGDGSVEYTFPNASGSKNGYPTAVKIYDSNDSGKALYKPEKNTAYKISFKYKTNTQYQYANLILNVRGMTASYTAFTGDVLATVLKTPNKSEGTVTNEWVTAEAYFETNSNDYECLGLFLTHNGTADANVTGTLAATFSIDDVKITKVNSVVITNTYDEYSFNKDKLIVSGMQAVNTFANTGNSTKVLQFNSFSGSNGINGVKIYNSFDNDFASFVPKNGKTYEISFDYRTYYGNYNDLYINVRGTTGADLSGDILANAVVIPKKNANFKDEIWRQAKVLVAVDNDYNGLAITFEAAGTESSLGRYAMLDNIKISEYVPKPIINTYDDEGVYYKKSGSTDNWRRFTDDSLSFGSESSAIDYGKTYQSVFARWGAFETENDNQYYKFKKIYVNPTNEPNVNIRIYDPNTNQLFVPEKNTAYEISLKYKSTTKNNYNEKYLDLFGVVNTAATLEGENLVNVVTVPKATVVDGWTTITAQFTTGDVDYNSLALVLTGNFTGLTETATNFYIDDVSINKADTSNITNNYEEKGIANKPLYSGLNQVNVISNSGNDTIAVQFKGTEGSLSENVSAVKIYNNFDSNYSAFVPEKNSLYKITFRHQAKMSNYYDLEYSIYGNTDANTFKGDKLSSLLVMEKGDNAYSEQVWRETTAYFYTDDSDYESLSLNIALVGLNGNGSGIWPVVDDIVLTKVTSTEFNTVNTVNDAEGFALVTDGSVFSVNKGDSVKLELALKNSETAVGSVIAVKVDDVVTPIITIDEENADFGIYATTFTANADGEVEIVVYNNSEILNADVKLNAIVAASYEVAALKGDANLDGVIDLRDLVNIKKSSASLKKLYGDYLIRADLNNDGEYSADDLSLVRRVLLGDITTQELTDVDVSYDFANDTVGSAEGTITISTTNEKANNYYDIYWANNDVAIADTYYIGSVRVLAGSEVTVTLDSNKAIPSGATQIMIFDGLNYKTYDLPTEKLGNFKYSQIPFVKDYTREENISNVAVVYSGVCEEDELATIRDFRSVLSDVLGAEVELLTPMEAYFNKNNYYIVIGDVTLMSTSAASSELKNKTDADFVIMQSSNKTLINAKNLYGYDFAFDYFFDNVCINEDSAIATDYKYVSNTTAKEVSLAGKDITEYTVIKSSNASIIEMDAIDYLVSYVLKNTGKLLAVTDDTTSVNLNEIVIGVTSRTASDYKTNATVSTGNGYTITIENDKTYITGNSNSAINVGVLDFVNRLNAGGLTTGTYSGEYDNSYSLTNGYKLTWSEEFNGTELSDTWTFCDADGYETVSGGETVFSMDNGTVANGALTATSYKVENSNNTSGYGVYTRGKSSMYFKYGYVEARIKLSAIKGYETALWMTTVDGGKGANYFIGEFDIFETCVLKSLEERNEIFCKSSAANDGYS